MIIADDKSDVGGYHHVAEDNDSEFSDYQSLEDEYLHQKNASDDDSSSSSSDTDGSSPRTEENITHHKYHLPGSSTSRSESFLAATAKPKIFQMKAQSHLHATTISTDVFKECCKNPCLRRIVPGYENFSF
jgi:hypothetical protein